jgi:hypothetical protein
VKGIFSIIAFSLAATGLVASLFGIPILVLWLALIWIGQGHRAAKAEANLKSVLMAEEQIVGHALQKRVLALFNRRTLLAITSSRVIIMRRGLLGGFKMSDIQWKDLLDATISENVIADLCGSNLSFRLAARPLLALRVNGVPRVTAATVYSHAQHQEQAWEEKRRVRAMEEVRAAAGGVTVHAQPQAQTSNRMMDDIQQAKALFDTGAISDTEFQEMKSKILAG